MKKNVFFRHSVCAAAVLCATSAFAQVGSPPGDDAKTAGGKAGAKKSVEEVLVTAQKRVQSLQSTAFSITAIKGDELAATAKNTVADALRDVPGVQVQTFAQGAQIFIRGVGSSIDPSFADPAIAMMTDGVYSGRTESVEGGGFDTERVEVLRGPQGTLYGRNASGGAVNVITTQPKLGVVEGSVRAQIGNWGAARAEAIVNLPLGKETAIRIAAFKEKHDSYIDNGGNDSDTQGVRLKLFNQSVPWLKLNAKAEYFHSDGIGANTVPVAGSAGNLTFPPPLMATNFDPTIVGGPPFTGGAPIWKFPNGWVVPNPSSPWSNDATHAPGITQRTGQTFMVQVDADLDWASLTVLPAYSTSKNYLYSSFLFGTLDAYQAQQTDATYKSIEVRLTSQPSSPVSWLLGAYYLKSEGGAGAGDMVVNNLYNLSQSKDPSETKALFGQITYPISNTFRATVGLRASVDTQASSYRIANITNPAIFDSGLQVYDNKLNSSSFKLGIEYDLAAQSLLYAHVASGFKQGGISATLPPSQYQPEELVAYEIGVKNRFLDNTLTFNASAFYYDYDKYQISTFSFANLPGTTTPFMGLLIMNAGKTNISGIELAGIWKLSADHEVRFSANNLDAKYGDIVLPNNPFANQGDYQLKGRRMANSPEWVVTLGYSYKWDALGGSMSAGVDTRWSDGYFVTHEEYLPGAYQNSYTRTDATLRYTSDDDRWSLSAYVKNIENKAQTTYVFPAYRRNVTPPRTVGVTAEYRF